MNNYNFTEYKDLGLTGLANLGNSCYLNSFIQVLSHTYELNNFLKYGNYQKKLNNINDSVMLLEWDKLRELMWSENCTIAPHGFFNAVRKIAINKDKILFSDFQQNDIYEFLLFMIDCFHNGLSREVDMQITGITKNKVDKLAEECYKMMKEMYKKEYSEILELFYGISVTKICSFEKNKTLSIKPDPYSVLHLSLSDNSKTLYDCINEFCEKEELKDENAWFNEIKNEKENVNKGVIFWSFPKILIILLKRWNYSGKKIHKIIDIPLSNLDLSKYVEGYNPESYIYDLYGICNHSGSSLGGHYTAYVKNFNNKWYEYNDTNVNEIDENKLISAQSYCLFYRKKK